MHQCLWSSKINFLFSGPRFAINRGFPDRLFSLPSTGEGMVCNAFVQRVRVRQDAKFRLWDGSGINVVAMKYIIIVSFMDCRVQYRDWRRILCLGLWNVYFLVALDPRSCHRDLLLVNCMPQFRRNQDQSQLCGPTVASSLPSTLSVMRLNILFSWHCCRYAILYHTARTQRSLHLTFHGRKTINLIDWCLGLCVQHFWLHDICDESRQLLASMPILAEPIMHLQTNGLLSLLHTRKFSIVAGTQVWGRKISLRLWSQHS